MGEKLVKYFELVGKEGGIPAKMRLAMRTGIASDKAKEEPDSKENLESFHRAAKEIVGPSVPKL